MTDKVYTDEPLLTQKAIQQSIFNAVKLKTNVKYVGTGTDDANDKKTGGPFSNAIWLATNHQEGATTSDSHKQYILGNIYDIGKDATNPVGREIGSNTGNRLYNNLDYVAVKTINDFKTSNDSTTSSQINANTNIGLPKTDVYKVPLLDGNYVLNKFLYNDILVQSLANKSVEIDESEQKMFLDAYDVVEVKNDVYKSEIYKTTPEIGQGTVFTYTLNNTNNTFEIDGLDAQSLLNNDLYLYYPTKLYVKTLDSNAFYTCVNDEINSKGDTNNKINYMYNDIMEFVNKYTYKTYTLKA